MTLQRASMKLGIMLRFRYRLSFVHPRTTRIIFASERASESEVPPTNPRSKMGAARSARGGNPGLRRGCSATHSSVVGEDDISSGLMQKTFRSRKVNSEGRPREQTCGSQLAWQMTSCSICLKSAWSETKLKGSPRPSFSLSFASRSER
jgi:hypothetical protein